MEFRRFRATCRIGIIVELQTEDNRQPQDVL
jgi:hypothetical protein